MSEQSVLDATGKVLVLTTTDDEFDQAQVDELLRGSRASLLLVLRPGETVDALDEDQMRENGWVRA